MYRVLYSILCYIIYNTDTVPPVPVCQSATVAVALTAVAVNVSVMAWALPATVVRFTGILVYVTLEPPPAGFTTIVSVYAVAPDAVFVITGEFAAVPAVVIAIPAVWFAEDNACILALPLNAHAPVSTVIVARLGCPFTVSDTTEFPDAG